MKRLSLLLLISGLACSPTQPTAPTPIEIVNQNTNNNGGASPSPNQCVNPDTVDISVPGTIEHGTPVSITAIPSVAGQVQSQNICAMLWTTQAPCFVGNAASLSTSLNASAQDLSGCSVQAQVGTTHSGVAIVRVN